MKTTEAFMHLGLEPDASTNEVKVRWRQLANQYHPDKPEGDATTFQTYREAYQVALAHARKPKRCDTCNGVGKVEQRHGFSVIKVRCKPCKGTGKL